MRCYKMHNLLHPSTSMFIPIGFGLAMALIDAFVLSGIKAEHIGSIKSPFFMIIPTLVYALQPWIFRMSLDFSTLTVMNLLWDLISDILVTAIGLWWFGETLSGPKKFGIVLSFVSIYLLTCC